MKRSFRVEESDSSVKNAFDIFRLQFERAPSKNEENAISFLANSVREAVLNNYREHKVKLSAAILAAISPKDRYDYSMGSDVLGRGSERNFVSRVIRSFFDKNIAASNALIEESNKESGADVETISDDCSEEEKKSLREFCFIYVVDQVGKLYTMFNKEELAIIHQSFPKITNLVNGLEPIKISLGIDEEDLPSSAAGRPIGYNLRSRGEDGRAEVKRRGVALE